MKIDYRISAIKSYINWDYFYFAWGIHQKSQEEKLQLRQEAERMLARYGGRYEAHALFLLAQANSDGDDVVLLQQAVRLPFLRQQQGESCLCMADFVRPLSSGNPDQIGLFATSVDEGMAEDFADDPYERLMMQLLADRVAEAAAERLHKEVRQVYWGYAPHEHLDMAELHMEKFQGIRPAVGYPSLPDASLNFLLDEVLCLQQIGIRLTESGAMKPHASVSGLMLAHPEARYFSVGRIDETQLADYARRRGLPIEEVRIFLSSNLS